ncbi:MAG: isoprenylcysteine carboxylmethyltransferase family protein [Candidatus Bathyarchaeota archaeon]|nr:isoprenylcysteine carboxylmethyltransferase family protein [Candidatus Bathyarchaeota archaeon]MDH5790863.1 isoprenylcysteine carboxylmethyltransferase family protein [Candidatus Bathyarchaeota archaeon]
MSGRSVDLPSLLMVLLFSANMVVAFWDPFRSMGFATTGKALIVVSAVIFVYTVAYLRRGFFGETETVLDHLVTGGPYRFCRHPLYLSFIVLILGLDLWLGSVLGVAHTLFLSIPSAVYRARVEDRLLREKFGAEWVAYAERVGFLIPKPTRDKRKMNGRVDESR